jgi:SpoVK/Ycf46/Vps4 family AAA+-type ATPase
MGALSAQASVCPFVNTQEPACRHVYVPKPDVKGRTQILELHMKKVPKGPDVKLDIVARGMLLV